MRTAIVYYSMSGNTAYTAQKISDELQADLIEIKPEKQYPDKGIRKYLWGGKSAVMAETPRLLPYEFQPEKYEQVIFGFPVWAGNIAPPLRTFIRENSETLKEKKISAFAFSRLAVCLGIPAVADRLVLIDPKEKSGSDAEERIKEFCGKCR